MTKESATRERFEKYVEVNHPSISLASDGEEYCTLIAQIWWTQWQAATADMDELLGALRAIVADAKDRNEPGQSWITIRGGLIETAEAVLARYGKS